MDKKRRIPWRMLATTGLAVGIEEGPSGMVLERRARTENWMSLKNPLTQKIVVYRTLPSILRCTRLHV